MRKVDVLQRRVGLNMQRIDWRCSPVFSIPLDIIWQLDPDARPASLPVFHALHGPETIDPIVASELIGALFSAEKVLKKEAGTLEELLEFSQERMPLHPTLTYMIPVGLCMLENKDAAKSYVKSRLNGFRFGGEPRLQEIYERFIAEVAKEFSW